MRSITPTPPRTQTLPLSLWISTNYADFCQNIFFDECAEKPAVCSKFRECAKAIRNIKSVTPLSPNGLIKFF